MEKCEHCPLKRFEETKNINCIALKHIRYCTLAAEGSSHNEAILRKSAKSMGDEVLPSLLERAKNGTVALLKIGAQTLKGGTIIVPPDVKQSRIDICYGCEHYMAHSDSCGKCGCLITNGLNGLVAKTDVSTEKCPEGKWGEYNEPHVTMHVSTSSSTQKSGGCGCGS